jgi:cytoskeletal protein RodZ
MKKIINAIKDFLYNITDYGLIITVVVIMIAVLAWRFDILFNKGIEKEAIASIPNTSQNANTNEGTNSENNENNEPSEEVDKSVITVEIPQGSLPGVIAEILVNVNLIEDENEFLSRSVALGLDTKLQSGTYEIEKGMSIDDVIKIIAHMN